MSLLVWAPLTNTSGLPEQNGTSSVTWTLQNGSSSIVIKNDGSGKIAPSCYERVTMNAAEAYRTSAKLPALSRVTMCCWAYVIETVGDTANGLITNHSHSDNAGLGITVKQVSTSDYRISCSTGNGTNRTYMTYYGTTNIKNKWCHLALTYDGVSVQLYVNGVLEKSQAYGNKVISDYFDIFNWSTTHYTNASYRPKCKLQDVRLYDEVLSAKELREIAKGLAVHIPCNQPWRSINLFNINSLSSYTNYVTNPTIINATDFYVTFNTSYTGNVIAIKTGYSYTATTYTFSGYIRVNERIPKSKYLTGYMSTYGSNLVANEYDPISGFFRITQNMPSGTTWDIHCPTTRTSGSGDVVRFSQFKIELGNNPHPVWTEYNYFDYVEHDVSGFKNNGSSSQSSNLPKHYGENTHGSSYYFTSTDFICLCQSSSFIKECTISFWAKMKTLGSSGFLPISDGTNSNNYIMASSAGTGNFYNGSTVAASGTIKYFIDGAQATKPIKDTKWHHYCITGINLQGKWSLLYLNKYTSSGWNSEMYYSDIRVYTTVFSDTDAMSLTARPISITKTGKLMTQGEYYDRRLFNAIDVINTNILLNTFSDGLSSYTQSNCSVTLTTKGYRIYRPPNINPTDNGNTMWGGLKLQIVEKLLKGRTYIILFDVTGKSNNNATSWGFSNNMGWSGGGLYPNPSDVTSCNIGTNFLGSKTCWYKFTINDDVYKKCTASYSSFVAGNTYPSYRDFMFGFDYQATGSNGTDLYLSNFRLYDITGSTINPRFTKNGLVDISDMVEGYSTMGIGKPGFIKTREFIEY